MDVLSQVRLGEATFAGNAVVTINATTPYNAAYGRAPRLLPSWDMIENEVLDSQSTPRARQRHSSGERD